MKVGIIGYTTEETPDISDTGTLVFNDVVETVRTVVQLRKKSQYAWQNMVTSPQNLK